MTFVKRIGPSPQENKTSCVCCCNCPDIWEMDDGNFAIIGTNITDLAGKLPPSAGCGPNERIVLVPRNVLVNAKRDIPDSV